ncbi:hypothetical protein CsatA_019197 [Cannabis sativa]
MRVVGDFKSKEMLELRARLLKSVTNLKLRLFNFGVESEYSKLGEILQNLFSDLYEAKTLMVCSYTLQVILSMNELVSLRNCLDIKHLILIKDCYA